MTAAQFTARTAMTDVLYTLAQMEIILDTAHERADRLATIAAEVSSLRSNGAPKGSGPTLSQPKP
jgi:hypothetical protein